MSYNRHARRVDDSAKIIIEAVRKAGYEVSIIGRPVDVAVRHPTWPANWWRFCELKTPRGVKNPKAAFDKRRKDQNDFVSAHHVPYFLEPEAALMWLRDHGPRGPMKEEGVY